MNAIEPSRAKPPQRGPKTGAVTRERLLDVAEDLFATEGIDGVSLRRIMDAAGVGVSQLNYHFGTKKDLIRAIFSRKLDALNLERMRLLDEAEGKADSPRLEDILTAYFLPSLRTFTPSLASQNFIRLIARVSADSSDLASEITAEYFDEFQHHVAALLKRSLPGSSDQDIYWRVHILMCVVIQTPLNPKRIFKLSGGKCDPSKADDMFKHLLPMLAGAMRASPSE